MVVWFTGLSGAGKTTIANGVRLELLKAGLRCELLDGDECRKTICSGLGFSQADRQENVRRIGFVAQLLSSQDVVVLVSAISPYRRTREECRSRIKEYAEVYVDAPLQVCEARDPKGLYRRVRAGRINGFTGVDAPYEPPLFPELHCKTNTELPEDSICKAYTFILEWLADQRPRYLNQYRALLQFEEHLENNTEPPPEGGGIMLENFPDKNILLRYKSNY